MEEQKEVSLGGVKPQQAAPVATGNPGDEFIIPTDIVELPSLGKLYHNKQKTVTVKYLTADDENILLNPELIKSKFSIKRVIGSNIL
jgi:hypothetical protein